MASRSSLMVPAQNLHQAQGTFSYDLDISLKHHSLVPASGWRFWIARQLFRQLTSIFYTILVYSSPVKNARTANYIVCAFTPKRISQISTLVFNSLHFYHLWLANAMFEGFAIAFQYLVPQAFLTLTETLAVTIIGEINWKWTCWLPCSGGDFFFLLNCN